MAKNYRFKLSDKSIEKLTELGIPEYMHGGIIRYFDNHLSPGDFLTAVLSNDLSEAVARADQNNKRALSNYIIWLYNYAPGRPNGWGSHEAVQEWLNEEPVENQKMYEVGY